MQFAIIGDLTGVDKEGSGYDLKNREGSFLRAIKLVNKRQPEFVMSVGDLVSGEDSPPVSNDADSRPLDEQWKEFDGWAKKFNSRFYYAVGNHDIQNQPNQDTWCRLHGARYYYFTYKKILFLILDSEDCLYKSDGEENWPNSEIEAGNISDDQANFAIKALDDNPDVVWTFVFFHKGFWNLPEVGAMGRTREVRNAGWDAVETKLAERDYTVFTGHRHRYKHQKLEGSTYHCLDTSGGDWENGQDVTSGEYFTLATTGANLHISDGILAGIENGQFAHFMMVTIDPESETPLPHVQNFLVNDPPMPPPKTEEQRINDEANCPSF